MRPLIALILAVAAVLLVPADNVRAQPAADAGGDSATHKESDPLNVKFGRLTTLRLRADGSLLASDADAKEIKVIGPEGEQVGALKLEFGRSRPFCETGAA